MKNIIMSFVAVFMIGAISVLFVPEVSANVIEEACQTGSNSALCSNSQAGSVQDIAVTIINILLTLVGIIAVITIIISGIKFASSGGNAASVTAAKNGILYSVIGLVVALLAYTIVNFILEAF